MASIKFGESVPGMNWQVLNLALDELGCKLEPTNTEDPYAVAVVRRSTVVGHVPRKISAACSLFLRQNGNAGSSDYVRIKYGGF